MNNYRFYEDHYTKLDQRAVEWRELGGAVKAGNVARIASDLVPRKVLDVGCGTGAVLAHLSSLGFGESYWALDIAATAISLVKQRTDIPELVDARVFDGMRIPYDEGDFDLAILSHVVEHLEDPSILLREVARVASYVAIEVPLEDNLHTRLKMHLFKNNYRAEIGHIQWFNRRSFKGLLEDECGLKVIDMRMVPVPDQLYRIRKREVDDRLNSLLLFIRRTLRTLSLELYGALMTDHCIALVRPINK